MNLVNLIYQPYVIIIIISLIITISTYVSIKYNKIDEEENSTNNLNQAKTLLLTFVISFLVLIGGYFGIKYAGKNNLFERVIQKGGVNGAFENDFLDNLTYEDNDVDFDIMDE
jgi:CDP-diglyceride synthetase